MKKKIFFRIFVLLFLAVAILFVSGLWAVQRNSEKIITERLTVEADLLSHIITSETDIAQLESYKNMKDFRITVILEDGTVLYESSISGELESHADREEVIAALSGNPHTVERYSETFDCSMTYYAVRSELENGEVIVLRLAVRSSEIQSYLTVALPFMLFVLTIALIISGLLASKLSDSLSSKVNEVAVSLKSLRDGEYQPIKTDSRETEFYAVFREINELNERTLDHIQTDAQERKKLNVVLDNVAQGIIALDPSGNIAFANNSAYELFGGTKNDTGKHLVYMIEDTALCGKLGELIGVGGSFEYSYENLELAIVVRVIEDDALSSAVSSIIIVTDITKAKKIAKEKSDFFANASHELKTPITVMQGLSELMLAKGILDESAKKQIEQIHRESMRMGDLIADMLKLSNLERHDEELQNESVELRTVADEVISELSHNISEKSVKVTVNGNGKVWSSSKKMYELMSNLCSNAVNYNKEGGSININISQNRESTVLTVEDTGIGIEKKHLPRLCERFYRVDKSHSKKTGGTGLGLAIVKHICALYGAELKIESEFGEGTKVTVVFHNINK